MAVIPRLNGLVAFGIYKEQINGRYPTTYGRVPFGIYKEQINGRYLMT